MMTVWEAVKQSERFLATHGVPLPRLEGELLLSFLLGIPRVSLYLRSDAPFPEDKEESFRILLSRRASQEPLQYIVGRQEFWGLEFDVTPDVLIPRPETEVLVEEALTRMGKQSVIVDLGTGSGCIAIALAVERPDARIWATDISLPALSVSRRNAERLGVADRITFLHGDLFEPLERAGCEGQIDLILSNPPYISPAEWRVLPAEVREFEPFCALYSAGDGLTLHRRILAGAGRFVREEGYLILEVGKGQAEAMRRERSSEFRSVGVRKDLSGIDRVVLYQKGREGG